jgi:hypothetical protein
VATSPVMRLLADGVPLTLLCDLVATRPPESEAINLNERPVGDELYAEAVLLVANHAREKQAAGA